MIGGEGSTYGKYFLIKRLAIGGMGEIFLAKLRGPVGFKKLLAIKRILPHHSANEQFVNMFFAEARVTAQLSHPHIVQIYEMGEIERSYYLAMEYVAGKPLREIIDRARNLGESVPAAHAATIIADLCGGLSFAHNAKGLSGTDLQIIHRDVNPANLLVSYTGDLKLIDFGIAKSEASNDRTEAGTIKGKFVYMSPEQSAAQPLDKRSDIFSVGICLYETLTGNNPFVKSNAVLSMDAIQRLELPPPSQHNRKLAAFDPIMTRALAKKREDRYSDCAELADDLQNLVRTGAIEPPRTSLADYMSDLFEDQIASERRIIANALETTQTDILSNEPATPQARRGTVSRERATRQLSDDELSNMGRRNSSPFDEPQRERRNSGRRLAAEAGLEPASRLPFYIALTLIVMLTIVGSVWLTRRTIERRRAHAVAETARRLAEAKKIETSNTRFSDPNVQRIVDKARANVERAERDQPVVGSPQPGPGSVQVITEPSLLVTRGGRGTSVDLAEAGGDFTVGSGASAESDPFALAVHYAVSDNALAFTLQPDPWAFITCNNATSGRSPQTVKTSAETVACELSNPNGRKLKVTLRRTR